MFNSTKLTTSRHLWNVYFNKYQKVIGKEQTHHTDHLMFGKPLHKNDLTHLYIYAKEYSFEWNLGFLFMNYFDKKISFDKSMNKMMRQSLV